MSKKQSKLTKPKPPTARQMKAFAKKFYDAEWKECCEHKAFLEAVSENLVAAEYLAVKILSGDEDEIHED